jgi:2-dehydro-3-deoxyphosphogluconate aldolase / (4S)-4-hydroxy-2-oxoglutarate aldolase
MTDPRPAIPGAILGPGVIAIARRLDPDSVAAVADGLLEGGILAFELTLNEPEATTLAAIADAVRRNEGTGMLVGAGTVLSLASARRAIDAGAAFLVAPHLDPEIVAWAASRGIPMFPGGATPTEVLSAWRAGAAGVKVFPASALGPTFLRELRGPLPDIPLLPTGGVTIENAASYIEAGAIAVGLGSWLFADRSPASVAQRARRVVQVVAAARPAGDPSRAPAGA